MVKIQHKQYFLPTWVNSGMNIPSIRPNLFWLPKNPTSYIWDPWRPQVEFKIWPEVRWFHSQGERFQGERKLASSNESWSQSLNRWKSVMNSSLQRDRSVNRDFSWFQIIRSLLISFQHWCCNGILSTIFS